MFFLSLSLSLSQFLRFQILRTFSPIPSSLLRNPKSQIMPFPWKKTRGNRISQIVADLQSPKHGGSLVVETGFPTSLVDLFVKQRDRLKKPSPRKKSKKKKPKLEIHDPIIATPHSPPPSSPRPITDPIVGSAIPEIRVSEKTEAVGGGGNGNGNRHRHRHRNRNGNGVVALKVFVVAVMALGTTKKVVIWITIFAASLLLLEFLIRFLKPRFNSGTDVLRLVNKLGDFSAVGSRERFHHLGIVEEQEQEQEHENQQPEQEQEQERERNDLGYLILVVIVLAGLFGGRIVAVMLTIGGCFLIKMIEIFKTKFFN